MSWLARSIANSLRIDDDEEVTHKQNQNTKQEDHQLDDNQQRGVKEDLSEFTETLTRQIWGVASFLAPPPIDQSDRSVSDRNPASNSNDDASDYVRYSGFRSESEKYRGGGFSDLAHTLPFRLEDQIGDAVGITEESLAFASNIAHHPETWLDFPISEEEDIDDFDISDAQYKHAMAVERLAPRLAALRIELCPAHMSKGYFWKVVEARAMWMQELQKRTKPESDQFGRSTLYAKESPTSFDSPKFTSLGTSAFDCPKYTAEFETEKHLVSSESQVIDKAVIQEEPAIKTRDKEFVVGPSYNKIPVVQYEEDDDEDDWLEQNSELDGYSGPTIFFGTDEDVSFTDLEDNDDCTMPVKSKPLSNDLNTSTKTS